MASLPPAREEAPVLLGDDSSISDRVGIAWVMAAGWVMGTTTIAMILGALPNLDPGSGWALALCGLGVAFLSALPALRATGARTRRSLVFRSLVGALLASLFCPALTFVLLGVVSLDPQGIALLVGVSGFGAVVSLPLGLVFGVIYTFGLLILRIGQDVRSLSSMDIVKVRLGSLLALISLLAALLMANHSPFLGLIDRCVAVISGGLALWSTLRLMARRRFVRWASRGKLAGWSVAPAELVDGARSVPRLFPSEATHSVLVRVYSTSSGPYRGAQSLTPIARI